MQKLECDQTFFTKNTIEIWSNKKIDLTALENHKLLTLQNLAPYGGGIKSAKLLD